MSYDKGWHQPTCSPKYPVANEQALNPKESAVSALLKSCIS